MLVASCSSPAHFSFLCRLTGDYWAGPIHTVVRGCISPGPPLRVFEMKRGMGPQAGGLGPGRHTHLGPKGEGAEMEIDKAPQAVTLEGTSKAGWEWGDRLTNIDHPPLPTKRSRSIKGFPVESS